MEWKQALFTAHFLVIGLHLTEDMRHIKNFEYLPLLIFSIRLNTQFWLPV